MDDDKKLKFDPEVRAAQEIIRALEKLNERVLQERALRAAAVLIGCEIVHIRPVVVGKTDG